MSDGSGSTSWTYDARGRMTQETKTIGSDIFVTQWGYNSADLVLWMKYPLNNTGGVGEQVNYTYLPQMLLDTVSGTSTYVYNTDYDAAGRVTVRELGASSLIDNHYTYYDWTAVNGQGRLSTIISHKSTPDLQNLAYTYDANGDVLTIRDYMDKTGNNPQTQTFTYDALDRLTSAKAEYGTNGIYLLQNYTYNATTGNLESKAGVNYTYDTAHKHAVAAISTGMNYAYDANGNQTARWIPEVSSTGFTYDAENRLVGVSGGVTATFTYDGDGNRVKGVITSGTTTTSTYIGSYFEWTGSTSTMKKYYYAGSTRVAMRTGSSTPNYLLGDHLGSNAITTNSSGVRIAEIRYYPWGTTRYTYGTSPTTYQYTGQRVETSLGLLFYNARWYDPSLGRFLQADTIVPGAGNPQAYDRYAYTLNNPIKYIDPSGHLSCSAAHVADGDCSDATLENILSDVYGVSLVEGNLGNFSEEEIRAIYRAVVAVGDKFRQLGDELASGEAFKNNFGYTIIVKGNKAADGTSGGLSTECQGIGTGGCTTNANLINFVEMSGSSTNDISRMEHNVVHEFGHSYDMSLGYGPRNDMSYSLYNYREQILRPNMYEGRLDWQQNLTVSPGETFADMFIAWTYDTWNTDPNNRGYVSSAQNWMNGWVH
jgi:RHS repeat-associated protein